jgi:myosin heavy subunit
LTFAVTKNLGVFQGLNQHVGAQVDTQLSFGGGSSRSSSGNRGFSGAQRKEKKRKQEFHKHKIKFAEEERPDFQHLKERTVVALDRLGHQVFSLEPGGYSLHNWMTSFNLLLDDFEDKVGGSNLPKEYYEKRQMLTADLLKPLETSDLDSEIDRLGKEIDSLNQRLSKELENSGAQRVVEKEQTSSRMTDVKRRHAEAKKELADAKVQLDEAKKEKRSFLRRIFLQSDSPINSAQQHVNELEEEQTKLENEMHELQEKSTNLTQAQEAETVTQSRERIQELAAELGELEGTKLEKMQLFEKRERVTKELAEVISSINYVASEDEAQP